MPLRLLFTRFLFGATNCGLRRLGSEQRQESSGKPCGTVTTGFGNQLCLNTEDTRYRLRVSKCTRENLTILNFGKTKLHDWQLFYTGDSWDSSDSHRSRSTLENVNVERPTHNPRKRLF